MLLLDVIPKLPMRDKNLTKQFYLNQLKFVELADYGDYLLLKKDAIEIHFFQFTELNPKDNYGQIYIRVDQIDTLHQEFLSNSVKIHPNGQLEFKPWQQKEFSILDPDNNLLTFGQTLS